MTEPAFLFTTRVVYDNVAADHRVVVGALLAAKPLSTRSATPLVGSRQGHHPAAGVGSFTVRLPIASACTEPRPADATARSA